MKRFLTLLAPLALGALLHAGPVPVLPANDAYAFQKLTVTTSTVVSLSTTNYVSATGFGTSGGGTSMIFCTNETDKTRFEVDGSSPTSTTGHLLAAGDSVQIDGYIADKNLHFIGAGTVSSTVQCTFYKTQ
jgi:hypothetical protein